MMYSPMTEITKQDILNEQKKDAKMGYKYPVVDSLINFGRLDEDMDAVIPINLSLNISKINNILTKELNVYEYNPNLYIPRKFEGYLYNNLSLTPAR